jgi:hypothetical protein
MTKQGSFFLVPASSSTDRSAKGTKMIRDYCESDNDIQVKTKRIKEKRSKTNETYSVHTIHHMACKKVQKVCLGWAFSFYSAPSLDR